jgi:hypothetical protein
MLLGLYRLAKQMGRCTPAEMVTMLVEVRGVDGAALDLVDGLLIEAGRHDIAVGDSIALRAELLAIRKRLCDA